MLKSILFILIYSISLNAFDKVSNQILTVKDAVNISANSYLSPQQFALKYSLFGSAAVGNKKFV